MFNHGSVVKLQDMKFSGFLTVGEDKKVSILSKRLVKFCADRQNIWISITLAL